MVALKTAVLAGCGAFAAAAIVGWFLLHMMPTVVTVTDQRVVLAIVGGAFALTVATGTAGYFTARWRHAHSIPAKGMIGARAVGLLVAIVAVGSVVMALQPWRFPSANVRSVSPLVLGEYLAQGQVAGGLVVYAKDDEAVAYLQTNLRQWIAATIPQTAAVAVNQEISKGLTYSRGAVATEVGDGQQGALRTGSERLWLVIGAMGLWAVAVGVIQRYRWRDAPWPAPVASDTLRSMVRFYARQG